MILPIIYVFSVFGGAWLIQNNCNECHNIQETNIEKHQKISYNCASNRKSQKKKPSFYH